MRWRFRLWIIPWSLLLLLTPGLVAAVPAPTSFPVPTATPIPGIPDLIVTDVGFKEPPVVGEPATLRAAIVNGGNAASPPIEVDGIISFSGAEVFRVRKPIGPLAPAEVVNLEWTDAWTPPAVGSGITGACVDPQNTVAEGAGGEANNCKSTLFEVQEFDPIKLFDTWLSKKRGPAPHQPFPFAAETAIALAESDVDQGGTVHGTITVTNQSTELGIPLPPGTTLAFRVLRREKDENRQLADGGTIVAEQRVGEFELLPGASREFPIEIPVGGYWPGGAEELYDVFPLVYVEAGTSRFSAGGLPHVAEVPSSRATFRVREGPYAAVKFTGSPTLTKASGEVVTVPLRSATVLLNGADGAVAADPGQFVYESTQMPQIAATVETSIWPWDCTGTPLKTIVKKLTLLAGVPERLPIVLDITEPDTYAIGTRITPDNPHVLAPTSPRCMHIPRDGNAPGLLYAGYCGPIDQNGTLGACAITFNRTVDSTGEAAGGAIGVSTSTVTFQPAAELPWWRRVLARLAFAGSPTVTTAEKPLDNSYINAVTVPLPKNVFATSGVTVKAVVRDEKGKVTAQSETRYPSQLLAAAIGQPVPRARPGGASGTGLRLTALFTVLVALAVALTWLLIRTRRTL